MFDILEAILYGEELDLLGKHALEPPLTPAERRVEALLQTLEEDPARRLRQELRTLIHGRHDEAFISGVRFGAQLMLQLTEGF